MGSSKITNAKPIPMENSNKKTFNLFAFIKSKFRKSKKPEIKEIIIEVDTNKNEITDKIYQQRKVNTTQNVNSLNSVLESFQKLELHSDINENEENDNEIDNFIFKVINVKKNERIQSHSSNDNGHPEFKKVERVVKKSNKSDAKVANNDKSKVKSEILVKDLDKTEEIIQGLENLEIGDGKKKKQRRVQRVFVARGPSKPKVSYYTPSINPYPERESTRYRQNFPCSGERSFTRAESRSKTSNLVTFNQINQINKQTLTGGKVIVTHCEAPQDSLIEVDRALNKVQTQSHNFQRDTDYLQDVLEYIREETNNRSTPLPTPEYDGTHADKILEDRFINELLQEVPQTTDAERETLNSILFNADGNVTYNAVGGIDHMFPTPPRSVNVSSPMLESPSSFYPPSNSECTLSPETSPIYNTDYEKYQVIPNFEEEKESIENRPRERTNSTSSMTMKNFRDMQKEIVCNFSKKQCCQINRKSCTEIFQERYEKLQPTERKSLCFKVSKLDMNNSFGVLHHNLLNLSQGSEHEDLDYAMFGLVCVHILSRDATMFAGDAGLSVLKSAAMRCPHRPVFTRYLVQCIRTALAANPRLMEDMHAVFHEVDVLGDTLVIACARKGDPYADVLAELVRAEPGQPPLFRTHHVNKDGYTALHVACSQHSAAAPHLHTVHVLLLHAGLDLRKGDIKGGDTAVHMAVNSPTCDLELVMMLFKQVDRKQWKNLAHCHNMSSVTPIEYARMATKSSTRPNYPHQVLEFLKKCR